MVPSHVPEGGETSLFGNGENSIYACIKASAILSVIYDMDYCVPRGKLGVGEVSINKLKLSTFNSNERLCWCPVPSMTTG